MKTILIPIVILLSSQVYANVDCSKALSPDGSQQLFEQLNAAQTADALIQTDPVTNLKLDPHPWRSGWKMGTFFARNIFTIAKLRNAQMTHPIEFQKIDFEDLASAPAIANLLKIDEHRVSKFLKRALKLKAEIEQRPDIVAYSLVSQRLLDQAKQQGKVFELKEPQDLSSFLRNETVFVYYTNTKLSCIPCQTTTPTLLRFIQLLDLPPFGYARGSNANPKVTVFPQLALYTPKGELHASAAVSGAPELLSLLKFMQDSISSVNGRMVVLKTKGEWQLNSLSKSQSFDTALF